MTRLVANRFEIPRANQQIEEIPGSYGLPFFGQTLQFLLNPRGTVKDRYEQHGAVSKVNVFYNKAVLFLGPEATQKILQDRDNNFSAKLAWADFFGDFAVKGLSMLDLDEHRIHRRIMQSAFKKQALDSYLPIMGSVIDEETQDWEKLPNFEAFLIIKEMLLEAAAKVFLGLSMEDEVSKVNHAFIDILNSSVAVIRYPVPGTKYWKGIQGKNYLVKFFGEIVKDKRENPGDDMFSRMCEATNENGDKFSDQEVVDHMMFIMLAAQDTTTATATNILYWLAKYPEWQERLRKEVMELDKETLSYEDLEKLTDMELVFKEALRLHTPLPVIPRRTINECELAGYTVPANTTVWMVPDFCHHMEEYYREPEKFDPMRFAPPREEHLKHQFAWHPFGGGAHICLGFLYANMQIKSIFNTLLKKYRFSLTPNYEVKYRFFPIPSPADNLPLIVERID